MKYRSVIYGGLIVSLCVIVVCGVIIWQIAHMKDVSVSFLNVGQGDAILVSYGVHNILIDGGADGTILLEELGRAMPFWDRTIDVMIATHPDADHINGLIAVFDAYSVKQLWHTTTDKDTSVFRALMQRAQREENIDDGDPIYGNHITIGPNASLRVIYPITRTQKFMQDVNDNSIAILLRVGPEVFYLGGDLSSPIEDQLMIDDTVSIVKASHHGARSSTSEIFLERTSPSDIIFSVGADNRYGHPHKETIDRANAIGANIWRTDRHGAITYQCNEMNCVVITDQ
jgi:competence protein ComEC